VDDDDDDDGDGDGDDTRNTSFDRFVSSFLKKKIVLRSTEVVSGSYKGRTVAPNGRSRAST
jgi:hypothetical protein